ncbi:MAG TPA: multiheme c-type cytochrome [Polyangia bacterium]|nr:multiheme c-type cytochrome [Polyangia bacterium]
MARARVQSCDRFAALGARDELSLRARHAHVLLAAGVALAACRGSGAAPAGAFHDAASADARDVVAAAPPRGRVLSLVYSTDVSGEYERCDCAVAPIGGFARRAAEVDRARAESDGMVQVDPGDLFLPEDASVEGGRPPAAAELERRARLIAAAYARLGVTAFSPGERDLALGARLLRRVLAGAKVPTVSATLADAEGRLLFEADRLVDAAGVRVGIFGVTAPSLADGPGAVGGRARRGGAWPADVVARDPVAAARAEAASLRARGAKLVVALVDVGGLGAARALLARAAGIDWAVVGHGGARLDTPELVEGPAGGRSRMLAALGRGTHLGRLDLHVVAGDGGGPYADGDARANLAARIVSHDEQARALAQRAPLGPRDEQRLVALKKSIGDERRELQALPPRVTGDWFENRIVALDTSVPDQPGTAALVAAYDAERARLGGRGRSAGRAPERGDAPGASARVGPLPGSRPASTYLGTQACARCHAPELAFWRGTKHARAFAALEPARSSRALACVGCHVTGFAQPGGSMDVAVLAARLRDVGCEACHGPGSAHVDAPRAPGLLTLSPSAATCLGCHTPDRTPAPFDLAALTRAIVGPGHGAPLN